MQKQRLILIIGIVLGIIAVFMIKVYLDQRERDLAERAKQLAEQDRANQSVVLIATRDIPVGAAIEKDMVDSKIVPNQYIQPQAVGALDRVQGMVAVSAIAKDEQITLPKLKYPQEERRGSSLLNVPPGKRAIAISVDNIASLVGMIRPNDHVDVIAMVPVPGTAPDGTQITQLVALPLFQDVLVLAVGDQTADEGGRYSKRAEKQEGSPLITLALGAQEANIIAFVHEQSKIRLTLRSPADSKIEKVAPANWDTVLQYAMPDLMSVQDAQKKMKPKVEEEYIEIYRGLSKEKLPLSK